MIIPGYGKWTVLYTDLFFTLTQQYDCMVPHCDHPLDIVLMQTDRGKCAMIACPVGGHWVCVKQSFIKQAERIIKTYGGIKPANWLQHGAELQQEMLLQALQWEFSALLQTGSPLGTHGNLLVKTNSGMVLVWSTSGAFLLWKQTSPPPGFNGHKSGIKLDKRC